MRHVFTRFPFLKDFVDCQALDNEWREHALLDFNVLDLNASLPAEIYWHKVFDQENCAGIQMFSNLKIVINLLLILPFSNASVERVCFK